MTRTLTDVSTVGFASTRAGAVSLAKSGWERNLGKSSPGRKVESQTFRGDIGGSLVAKKGSSPGRGNSMGRSTELCQSAICLESPTSA